MMQIGNAVINDETDTKGMYDYLASHAIISDKTAIDINNYCNFAPNVTTDQRKECSDATDAAAKATYYVNIYNIYAPSCLSTNLAAKPKETSVS